MFSNSSSNTNINQVTLRKPLGYYIERGAQWGKLADFEGTYNNGERPIAGWILKKDKFTDPSATGIDKLNVYLVIDSNEDESPIIARLPKSLGKSLVNDYEGYLKKLDIYDPEVAFMNYIGGASLRCIRTYTTKYGTPSARYFLWE